MPKLFFQSEANLACANLKRSRLRDLPYVKREVFGGSSRDLGAHVLTCFNHDRLYTKKAVKCADPRDRKVKRLLRKLNQRMVVKARRTMWLHPHMNLPVMSEVRSAWI